MDNRTVYKTDCGHYVDATAKRVVNIKVVMCDKCPMPHIVWDTVVANDSYNNENTLPLSNIPSKGIVEQKPTIPNNPFLTQQFPAPVKEPIAPVISQYSEAPDGINLTGVDLNDSKTMLMVGEKERRENLERNYAGAKGNPFLVKGIGTEPIDGINDNMVAMAKRSTLG